MGEPVRVLHVDDDADYLELTARLLERADPDLVVTSETDPETALDRLESEPTDCVLSDYEMPGTNGLEFLELVRERHPELPFVLFTAQGSEEIASEAITAGVTDYVRKEAGTAQFAMLANRIENAVGCYRSERRRRDAVERTHTVFDRIADGFFALDDEWRFTHLNTRAEMLLQRTAEDVLGTVVWDVFPEAIGTAFEEECRWAMATQEPVLFGEYFEPLEVWFDVRAYPGDDGLSVFFRDITERKRIQNELRTAETRMEALGAVTADLHTSETVTAVADRIVDAAENVLEFDICYVCLREGEQFVPVAASSTPTELELQTLPLDHGVMGETYRTGRSIRTDDSTVDPLADPVHGDYRSAITVPIGDAGVFQAVSKQLAWFSHADLDLAETLVIHAVEAIARVRSEERRRAERERVTALFENVPEPAIAYEIHDGVPIFRAVNSAFERVFGFVADVVIGENVDDFIVPPDRVPEASDLNEKLQIGETVEVESRRHTRSGERDFLLQVVPLVLGERNVEGFAIYTDITEQKARERKLERQNDRLEEFASVVSHDLRNPLSIAQGHLSLARENCTNPAAADYFDAVERAHDRMATLTEDVLSLARQGRTVGETQPVDVASTVAAAWASVRADEATFEIGDLGTVVADPDRLRQLLENLFSNAVEHAGPTVTVRVDSADTGFVVADDGPGIPTDHREQVFEAGYTDAADGTGFGLAIVKSIVDAHGWTIEVGESESGGASFEIRTDA